MIVLDIDGVVADYFSELHHVFNIAGWDVSAPSEWRSLKWSEIVPDADQDSLELLFASPLIAKNCKPFEDAWYWTNHYSSSYDIMYLTARDSTLSQCTWDWFFSWDMPADFVVFDKEKTDFLKNLQINVYVDDVPEIVDSARECGVNAFLMNRSYNQNYDINPEYRINSLWELKCV